MSFQNIQKRLSTIVSGRFLPLVVPFRFSRLLRFRSNQERDPVDFGSLAVPTGLNDLFSFQSGHSTCVFFSRSCLLLDCYCRNWDPTAFQVLLRARKADYWRGHLTANLIVESFRDRFTDVRFRRFVSSQFLMESLFLHIDFIAPNHSLQRGYFH